MKNKLFLAIIVILLLGAFFLIKDLGATKQEPVAVAGIYSQDTLLKIYSSNDLKYGFGIVGNNICYVASDFSIKFYNLENKQVATFSNPRSDVVSAKVSSNGNSCITQLSSAERAELYFSSQTQTQRMDSDYDQIESVTGNGYVVSGTKNMYVLDSDGVKIKQFDNQELLKVATSASDYYLINNYDEEAAKGDLSSSTNSGITKISSIADVSNLFANSSTILVGLNEAGGESVSLRGKTGNEITKIKNVDTSTVVTTKNGYLLATKLDVESQDNQQNSLIYLANNGTTENLLNSMDGSSEQYNITSIAYRDKTVYFLQNNEIYRINKDLDF